jgi:dGTPase
MRFRIRNREFYEQFEAKNLAPYAARSRDAHKTRLQSEREHPYQTAFQRDRDRIIHSRAFHRLKHTRLLRDRYT